MISQDRRWLRKNIFLSAVRYSWGIWVEYFGPLQELLDEGCVSDYLVRVYRSPRIRGRTSLIDEHGDGFGWQKRPKAGLPERVMILPAHQRRGPRNGPSRGPAHP